MTSTAPKVVAEFGQTMKGSIEVAHRQVDAAAAAGCWGWKTQLLTPERIAAPGAARYWSHGLAADQRTAFATAGLIPYRAWQEVADHAAEVGLTFVATPFDLEAVEVLAGLGATLKVASGDLTNVALLRACAATGRPLIVSTGAATDQEVDAAIQLVWDTAPAGPGFDGTVWLACSLVYPCPPRAGHVARVRTLAGCVPWPDSAGYSDHVGTELSAAVATAAGATVLEVHTTLDPGTGDVCADDAMALDAARLAAYVGASRAAAELLGSPRLTPDPLELPARRGARRSLFWTRDLAPGAVVTASHVEALRPAGVGVDASQYDRVVGAVLRAAVRAGSPVHDLDLIH